MDHTPPPPTPPQRPASRRLAKRRRGGFPVGDRLFDLIVLLLAGCILLITALAAFELFRGGEPALRRYGLGFLTGTTWDPVHEEFGALPFIIGTLVTSFAALLLAVPLAVGSALFVSEYAPRWLAEPVSSLVELLAAIPSVVYGFWGIFVLAPVVRSVQLAIFLSPSLRGIGFLRSTPTGLGLFTAVLILAVMIVPYTASVARDVLRLVPQDQREAAYALGATRWEVMRHAVLPYARAGILGGVLLSLGRALGETMAVTMVIGNRTAIVDGLFGQTATMASVIANEFTEANTAAHLSSLILVGLLLFLLTIVVNLVARVLIHRLTPRGVS
ncbi:MAG TPA: phosphate ABC transporter permease subunit PstC [Trueperaceae bacterium]|nr:phosphate ABC transporter permease subunit PstC [Trueperaceae bacterium]